MEQLVAVLVPYILFFPLIGAITIALFEFVFRCRSPS